MSDVFVSYASEDRPRAEQIADALGSRGWSVFWDRTIRVGATWDEVLERELADAKAVVVLWSKASVASDWVRAEAGDAAQNRKLVPAMIESVQVPLRFRAMQAADLTEWNGHDVGGGGWKSLLDALVGVGGLTDPRSPRPKLESLLEGPPASQPQPDDSMPPPGDRVRRASFQRRLSITVVAFALIAGAWLLWPDADRSVPVGVAAATTEPLGPSAAVAAPTVNLRVDSASIVRGQTTSLFWDTTNATEARIEPSIGVVPLRGSTAVAPQTDTTYRLLASNSAATTEERVQIRVAAVPATEAQVPQPARGEIVMPPGTGYLFGERRLTSGTGVDRDVWWNRRELVPKARMYSLGRLSGVGDVMQIATGEFEARPFEPAAGQGFAIEVVRDGRTVYAVVIVGRVQDEITLEWLYPYGGQVTGAN